MPSELREKLEETTRGGLFPLVAYGPLSFDSHTSQTNFAVLTTSIPELSYALKVFARVTNEDYNLGQNLPVENLQRLANENPHLFQLHTIQVHGGVDPVTLGKTAKLFGAGYWSQKAFALIDICGFSTLSPYDQLAYLLSLDNSVRSAIRRCGRFSAELQVSPLFSRTSTGDGYYLWHSEPGLNGDIAVLALLLSIMVGSEAMRTSGRFPMRLKGAFAVGAAFTFFDRLFEMEDEERTENLENAVGPVTNDLARLISVAKPSQIFVKHFERFASQTTVGPNQFLQRVASLFELEGQGQCQLEFDPRSPSPPLRTVDKHGAVHHCWNLVGTIHNTFADEQTTVQRIGLVSDSSVDVTAHKFQTEV